MITKRSEPQRHQHSSAGVLRIWVVPVLWVGLIMLFGTGMFSSSQTGKFFYPLLHYVLGIPWRYVGDVHNSIRAVAHVGLYAGLSVLIFRALLHTFRHSGRWGFSLAVRTVAMCVVVAIGDEILQSQQPLRGGSAWDVALDAAGAMLAQGFLFLRMKRKAEACLP